MSLHLNFEPHSWYMGFAIEKPEHNDPENYSKYYAYTDNTYRVDMLQADTLRELKQKIKDYRQTMADRSAEIRARLEARLKAEREAKLYGGTR